jgi:CTP synthase
VGINADVIVCRADYAIPEETLEKVAFFSDVDARAVIPVPTVDTIYEVPLALEEAGMGEYLVERLGLPATRQPDLDDWRGLVRRMQKPRRSLPLALVGKYVELRDAYISVVESLRHAGLHIDYEVDIQWVSAERLEQEGPDQLLADVCGIVVPGGFGDRGIEGKIMAAAYARERGIPYLGLCLGMQCATIAFTRDVLGLPEANSTEFAAETPNPVIDLMPDQRDITEKGGTMRLGVYPCELVPGTRAAEAYQVVYGTAEVVQERHRHRFEFNNAYRQMAEEAGMIISGQSPDQRLVEIIELRDHPWYVGSQFHPEFLSRPNRPHPLFLGFVAAAAALMDNRSQRDMVMHEARNQVGLGAWVAAEMT